MHGRISARNSELFGDENRRLVLAALVDGPLHIRACLARSCGEREHRRGPWYFGRMGVMSFDHFVALVREPLCILEIEPAFQLKADRARFILAQHEADLHMIDSSHVRLSLSAHGELIRTVELEMDEDAAWLAWNGIVAVFETAGDGAPID